MFKFEVTGIKCDNKICDYHDDSILMKDYSQFLNKPCPKCGANLLTQADYDLVLKIEKISNMKIIKFFNYIGSFFDKLLKLKPKSYSGKMNGSGKMKIEEKDDFRK